MADDFFDIVVIGGGVTGSGAALDAATRGLSVALVEQCDLASGTSSRSSKLIHGGLRYLEQLNFSLVVEALRERGLLLDRIAPHLVRPVSFVYPLQHRVWERAYVGAGVLLYDALASRAVNPLPRHAHISRSGALELIPSLRRESLVGGIRFWDAQVDDARYTVFVARTAAEFGAAVATSVRVTGLVREGDRVSGVEAVDVESGRSLVIRGRRVINATGVWTDLIQAMAGRRPIRIAVSKGIHLAVPRSRIESGSGMVVRAGKSLLFVIPWYQHWLIGTTDTTWNLDLAHPAASSSDIEYLLSQVNGVLAHPLTAADIQGVFAGLRPLLRGETDVTSKLSREHTVSMTVPGLVTVAGGKYTTYRVMAEDAVNVAVKTLGKPVPPSGTQETPLLGADGYQAVWNSRHSLARRSGLDVATIERLLGRYGTEIRDLLALIADRPDLGLALDGGGGYLAAEVVYAATHEAALHLDDVLTRRTRLSIEVPDRGLAAAEAAAPLMAGVLGWDRTTVLRELEHYRARVSAERDSQSMPNDCIADAVRLGAPDVRTGTTRDR